MTRTVFWKDPDLGRIFVPAFLTRAISTPGQPARLPREYGVVLAVQKRPLFDADGVMQRAAIIWRSLTWNERVDEGAVIQDVACFGAGTTNTFTAVAVATTGFTTKTKTDLSIGVITNHATTNEFTGSGLARAAGSLGAYTAPASLGATFSRVITKTFTATGSATAHGSGLFDNVTVASSDLYVEDIFGSDATLVTNDTLQISWTISN